MTKIPRALARGGSHNLSVDKVPSGLGSAEIIFRENNNVGVLANPEIHFYFYINSTLTDVSDCLTPNIGYPIIAKNLRTNEIIIKENKIYQLGEIPVFKQGINPDDRISIRYNVTNMFEKDIDYKYDFVLRAARPGNCLQSVPSLAINITPLEYWTAKIRDAIYAKTSKVVEHDLTISSTADGFFFSCVGDTMTMYDLRGIQGRSTQNIRISNDNETYLIFRGVTPMMDFNGTDFFFKIKVELSPQAMNIAPSNFSLSPNDYYIRVIFCDNDKCSRMIYGEKNILLDALAFTEMGIKNNKMYGNATYFYNITIPVAEIGLDKTIGKRIYVQPYTIMNIQSSKYYQMKINGLNVYPSVEGGPIMGAEKDSFYVSKSSTVSYNTIYIYNPYSDVNTYKITVNMTELSDKSNFILCFNDSGEFICAKNYSFSKYFSPYELKNITIMINATYSPWPLKNILENMKFNAVIDRIDAIPKSQDLTLKINVSYLDLINPPSQNCSNNIYWNDCLSTTLPLASYCTWNYTGVSGFWDNPLQGDINTGKCRSCIGMEQRCLSYNNNFSCIADKCNFADLEGSGLGLANPVCNWNYETHSCYIESADCSVSYRKEGDCNEERTDYYILFIEYTKKSPLAACPENREAILPCSKVGLPLFSFSQFAVAVILVVMAYLIYKITLARRLK